MSSATAASRAGVARLRTKLFAAMMLIVATLTALGFYLAQRRVTADAEKNLQQNFQAELTALHKLQELRDAALAERCRVLAEKPRIHAALEDNAIDLLYASAKDELRDLMQMEAPPGDRQPTSLQARFYRFLDFTGAVLPPPNSKDVGELTPESIAQLSVKKLPTKLQIGYLSEDANPASQRVDEVIVVPIFSTETGEVISALVVGFKPFEISGKGGGNGITSGIWTDGELHMPALPRETQRAIAAQITDVVFQNEQGRNSFRVTVNGAPHLLFYKRLNPDSIFAPAYEISVYPLAAWNAQLSRLRWQIGIGGLVLLLAGFLASHFIALRLAKPVERLALDSEQNRAQRKRAEAALIATSEKLKRSTRYSADASHQLKTPVTVLRAGLETLLAREDFQPAVYEELSGLLHQTHRLTGVIDDLLLLSRMDAGHLEIKSDTVNLSELVEEWLDDLSAILDSLAVKIERKFPANVLVAGEKRYTSLIMQNLLENAGKYNRPGGRIRVNAQQKNGEVVITVGNTGDSIARSQQEYIFDRFHRVSEKSGSGLGLSLARELIRLHGGQLKLVSSANDWTEFEVRFRAAQPNGHGES